VPTKPQKERRNKVLQFLRANQPVTARRVSEALDIHYTTANDDLHILQTSGLVRNDGEMPRGWRLTD
jgi:predicted ArsR family transcriptional regulator